MKRKALALALVMIVVLSVTAWIFHNQISEISELQNQIGELQAQNSELQKQNSDLQNQTDELQNQLIELQNKIDIARDVKITDFDWTGVYEWLVGVNYWHYFTATIKNMGDNNVSGLTLSVKLLSVETNAQVAEYTTQYNMIRAGQIVKIRDAIVAPIGSFPDNTAVCVITLTLGDVILDQWTRNLEKVMISYGA